MSGLANVAAALSKQFLGTITHFLPGNWTLGTGWAVFGPSGAGIDKAIHGSISNATMSGSDAIVLQAGVTYDVTVDLAIVSAGTITIKSDGSGDSIAVMSSATTPGQQHVFRGSVDTTAELQLQASAGGIGFINSIAIRET